MTEHIWSNRRNNMGVKDSANMWRTVDGVRWPQWCTAEMDDKLTPHLRKAGVRCRRFGEEIYVHPDDWKIAEPFAP